jgi:hypothetical protein
MCDQDQLDMLDRPDQPDQPADEEAILDPRLVGAEDLPQDAAAEVVLDCEKLRSIGQSLGVRIENVDWLTRYDRWRELAVAAGVPKDKREQACRGCRGKLRYRSRVDAVIDAKRLPAREGFRISIYECWVCAEADGKVGFHIGNTIRRLSGVNGDIRRPKHIPVDTGECG